jgi:hypothetical protein
MTNPEAESTRTKSKSAVPHDANSLKTNEFLLEVSPETFFRQKHLATTLSAQT